MGSTFFQKRSIYALGTAASLIAVVFFIASFQSAPELPSLNAALVVDLLLTVPLVYLIMIWKTEVPKITVVPLSVVSLILGYRFLPQNAHTYLDVYQDFIHPFLEFGVLTFVVLKARRFILRMKQHEEVKVDFFDAIQKVSSDLIPKKVAPFLATEIAVFYYAFFSRKKPLPTNAYTIHKNSGSLALLGAVIFLILVETSVIHLLLARWNDTVAWVLTILSIYTGLQMLGIARSIPARPVVIEDDALLIRYGIAGSVRIPFHLITSVQSMETDLEEGMLKSGLLAQLEPHNILIEVSESLEYQRLYGMRKSFRRMAFFVDDKSGFITNLEERLSGKE